MITFLLILIILLLCPFLQRLLGALVWLAVILLWRHWPT
jgi:hypothetical protein